MVLDLVPLVTFYFADGRRTLLAFLVAIFVFKVPGPSPLTTRIHRRSELFGHRFSACWFNLIQ